MADLQTLTHKELVDLGKQWLNTAQQCNPVFCEKGSAKSNERPDVIGWCSKGSHVMEAKTSLADFRADKKKPFRAVSRKGMGKFRWFIMTQELYNQIPKKEFPELWGVAVVDNRNCVRQARFKSSGEFKFNMNAELYYLRNRILEIQGFGT